MGLALGIYHESIGCLPMGYVAAPTNDAYITTPGWCWASMILPQVGQSPLFGAGNFDLAVEHPANGTARTAVLSIYICPSDTDSGSYIVERANHEPIGAFQTTSYAASFGTGIEIDEFPDRGNGLFRRNLGVRHAEVADGLSMTFAVGERGACLIKTPWAGVPNGGISVFSADRSNIVSKYSEVGRGAELVFARAGGVTINQRGTTPADFYSPHSGMGNFLFADGSARAVKSTIALSVYHALCTRAGGELVSDDDF
jgi:prepilin-type processing-associated H-X9-DG protein